jgi:hypothetical protein
LLFFIQQLIVLMFNGTKCQLQNGIIMPTGQYVGLWKYLGWSNPCLSYNSNGDHACSFMLLFMSAQSSTILYQKSKKSRNLFYSHFSNITPKMLVTIAFQENRFAQNGLIG